MKTLLILIGTLIVVLIGNSCQNCKSFSYYESGQLATAMYNEGFIEWSDGADKVMPFGQITVSGANIGK